MEKLHFETQYSYVKNRSKNPQFGTVNNEDSMTQQSDAAETDINVIMKKYGVTGQLPQVQQEALYGDFSTVTDYRTAVEMIRAADEAFADVPAQVRKDFDNDPAKFIEFAQNPDNIEKMREYKLADPAKPEPVVYEEPVPNSDRYDDHRGINDDPQRVLDTRRQSGGMEHPILPTNERPRTAPIQDRSQPRGPK